MVEIPCGFESHHRHQKSTSFDRGLSIFTYYLFTIHSSLKIRVDFWKVIGYSEEVMVSAARMLCLLLPKAAAIVLGLQRPQAHVGALETFLCCSFGRKNGHISWRRKSRKTELYSIILIKQQINGFYMTLDEKGFGIKLSKRTKQENCIA